MPTFSLVIPTYNQRARTLRAVEVCREHLRALRDEQPELIVVDDGSKPGAGVTRADLPSDVAFVGLPANAGKGGAVRAGILAATSPEIIFTDSDLPFSLDPITTTLAWLREDADIVIGDRLLPDSECATDVTSTRRLSSVVFTFLVQQLCRLPFDDTQCGYKGYRAPVAKALFGALQITSFAFDVEILMRARRTGARIRRQPLRLVHNEDTSVSLAHHAPRMMADTLRIAWRGLRGAYG